MTETIFIGGYEYPFNDEKEEVIDGHVYCKTCGERLDLEPLKLMNEHIIFHKQCACERKRQEEQKERERRQKIRSLKELCFPSPFQWEERFSAFQGEKTQAYTIAFNYAKEFKEMAEKNIGIIFFGNVGSGKSFLAACIANYLMEENLLPVKMRNFSEIINDLQMGGFSQDRNGRIDSLVSTPLLILDDLGIERDTAYAKEQVYQIINSRYLKHKPTIITTNLTWEMITHPTESMEYQRIYSRIVEMCIPVQVKASDFRKVIQKKKMEEIKKKLAEWRLEDD
jgi:DNA replication protein DnaC